MRETTFAVLPFVTASDTKIDLYNYKNQTTVNQIVASAYDYDKLEVNPSKQFLTANETNGTAYITYRIVAPEGRTFDALTFDFIAELPAYLNYGNGNGANAYVQFKIGYVDPIENGYDSFVEYYKQHALDSNDTNFADKFDVYATGKTEIFIQAIVRVYDRNWVGFKSISVTTTYHTVQLQINYGSSYTEYSYTQFNGSKLDLSLINIRENFIRLDDKIYMDPSFTVEYDVNSIVTSDMVLYVRVANGYINYNLDGGINGAGNQGYYESANGAITLADPVKKGYIFSGWYTDSDCTILFTNIEQGRFGNITLYAKWTKEVSIKIAFLDVDGGSLEGVEFDEVSGNYYKLFFTNVGIDSLPTPTKANAVFIGWYIGAYQYPQIFAGTLDNVTLTAKWAEIDEPALEPDVSTGDFVNARLTIATDLTLTYEATVENGESVAMLVTMNGKQVVVSAQEVGVNLYHLAFNNIAPHMMGANITTQLIVNNVVKDVIGEYSVAEYLINKFNEADSEELKTLVADTLNYGAMAQAYKNHDLDNLVNDNPEIMAYATNFEAVTESDYTNVIENKVEGFKIRAAGVYFDYVNYVYIKFLAGDNFKVTVAAKGLEETEIKNIRQDGGYYVAFSPEVSALCFDKVYTFKLYSGETLVQTVNYSVKAFVYNMQNGEDATANLAKALYNYGIASVNYKKVK